MNRSRGQTEVSAALWVVLMVIVILSLFGIFFAIKAWVSTETEDVICATEIRTHSTLAGLTNDEVAPQINCPTRIISTPVADNNAANGLLANEMMSCWRKWGKGEINIFGREEGIYCHVCSMVTIEGVQEVRGLPRYLEEDMGNGMTYSQFLAGTESGSIYDYTLHPEYGSWSIETKEPIGVIFYHAKGLEGFQRLESVLTGSISQGTTVGAVTGGVGLLAIGIVAGAVTAPVTLTAAGVGATITVIGGVTGGTAGLLASITKPELSTMSIVVVRPLNQQQIAALGCDYAPVAND